MSQDADPPKRRRICHHGVTPGVNRHAPIRRVAYHHLTPAGDNANGWASVCPACGQGTLGVIRDSLTLALKPYDICMLCAQRVEYTDIEQMRQKDWAAPEEA